MNFATNSRWPAFFCAFLVLACALATFPVAEIGMVDDWSYAQSARVLAQSDHIVYYGGVSPMLGWQLYLGALFVKLFGPSFTAIRASTFAVALLTAFLTHRMFVRAGISSRNATIGTLALVLGPLFLPLALSFMSDIGGLFCVVLCLYACLRALQAQSDRAVFAWLAFAAISNALGGTVRQIAWLGVLVMFPCAVWLLRRRRHVLLVGGLLYAGSALFIYAALHWFQRQPYSAPDHLFNGYPSHNQLNHLAVELLSLFLSGALLLLPVLVAFAPQVSLRNRRTALFLVYGVSLWVAFGFLAFHYPHMLDRLIAPFKGDYVTPYGVAPIFLINGRPPLVLSIGLRLCITVALSLALLYFFAFISTGHRTSVPPDALAAVSKVISWPCLLFLLVPFILAYVTLLLPHGLRWELYDRYLLLLLPIGLILLLRLYQDRVVQNLPWLSSVLVLLFAIYSVAGTHDAFGRYRAQQEAIDVLGIAGVPDTSIDGGFEHNAMAQIETAGYIGDITIFRKSADRFSERSSFPANCRPTWASLTPAVVGGYTLSFDPAACGGASRFAPVTYRSWLAHRVVSIYVVYTVKPRPGSISDSLSLP